MRNGTSTRPSQHSIFGSKLSGQVEAGGTFIGGKAANMHAAKRAAKITGTGSKYKTPGMGILERGSKATGS
jgi:hypothetical protein